MRTRYRFLDIWNFLNFAYAKAADKHFPADATEMLGAFDFWKKRRNT